jgi:hypothetical protein
LVDEGEALVMLEDGSYYAHASASASAATTPQQEAFAKPMD